ncbi:DNA helicase [Tanacetum coccineum]
MGNIGEPRIVATRDSCLGHVGEGSQSFVAIDSHLGCLVGGCFDGGQARNISLVGLCSPANVADNVNPTLHVHGFSQMDDVEVSVSLLSILFSIEMYIFLGTPLNETRKWNRDSMTTSGNVDGSDRSLSKRQHICVDHSNPYLATPDANFMLAGRPIPNVGNSSGVHVSSKIASSYINQKRTRDVMSSTTTPNVGSSFTPTRCHVSSGHHSLNTSTLNDDPVFHADSFNVHTNGSVFHENRTGPLLEYKHIGKCEHSCKHCGARFWYEEHIKNTRRRARPAYHRCCLIELLDNHNALVQLFRTAREKLLDLEVPPFKHIGLPQHVNNLHPSYMALQFPLLFVYDEDGYSKDMKMVRVPGASSDEDRRLTMKAYYSYMLHDHVNSFNYLLKTRRLFQQYMVTAFCAVEQSRIDYLHEHQNDIRNEYLSGIYDAIRCGDNDGSDCGGTLILPQSFIGGPRSIVTTADRAEIVDHVFEMKIHQFVKYLWDVKPFGKIIAIVYKVEFQKRGIPHCHTLIWVDKNSRIQSQEDIDNYISTELPSEEADPEGHRVVSEFMVHEPCSEAACEAMGLLGDNKEWKTTLIEASSTTTPRIPNLHINPSELENYTKDKFEACLDHCSRSLTDFEISLPPENLMSVLQNRLLMKEKSYNREVLATKRDKLLVTKNTQLATLLKETYLIIWDESLMNNRRCFETLDRTLRDILDTPNKLFGGKPIMLGGDFRQTLPIKKKASRTEIISSLITKSYLWRSFKLFVLTKNKRLTLGTFSDKDKGEVSVFANWLLNVGDGLIGVPDESDLENASSVEIP